MSIYITRHGQTDWNLEGRLQGKTDTELNATGIKEAEIAANNLKDLDIDLIISSTLKRAKKTAEIINKERNLPIIYSDIITERYFGEFQGVLNTEFDLLGFWDYEQNNVYEKAENVRDFFNKIYKFMDEIKEKYKDKNVLIVTHGGVVIAIDSYFNGINKEDDLSKIYIKNCEYKKYDFNEKEI